MRNMMALLYYLCALLGCDVGGTTIVNRSNDNGVDIIDSQVRISEQIAKFECRASRSGTCHYSLFRGQCANAAKSTPAQASQCTETAFERFDLAAGATREIIDIAPGFTLCVSDKSDAVGVDCKALAR
ncbi:MULTISPECIES: hypothetical protein [Lysobacter]|uniref:Lipoprotein n=1 Tax=Lysobacter gummosus TaxID=262324 RepID=A0ABY3XHD4_9GAMM|nr:MULTISPECIES: hypothetical protein [Lysobacter]UJB17693.1 hypothetical protein L1A79_15105 [Lysobacter capsici]UJQ28585.1 hypothetical protein L2D09_24785 [Lysobacter gummosus]UNP31040.1 hypothetical protein MOV92_07280 [Lysobacter gummosus]